LSVFRGKASGIRRRERWERGGSLPGGFQLSGHLPCWGKEKYRLGEGEKKIEEIKRLPARKGRDLLVGTVSGKKKSEENDRIAAYVPKKKVRTRKLGKRSNSNGCTSGSLKERLHIHAIIKSRRRQEESQASTSFGERGKNQKGKNRRKGCQGLQQTRIKQAAFATSDRPKFPVCRALRLKRSVEKTPQKNHGEGIFSYSWKDRIWIWGGTKARRKIEPKNL